MCITYSVIRSYNFGNNNFFKYLKLKCLVGREIVLHECSMVFREHSYPVLIYFKPFFMFMKCIRPWKLERIKDRL